MSNGDSKRKRTPASKQEAAAAAWRKVHRSDRKNLIDGMKACIAEDEATLPRIADAIALRGEIAARKAAIAVLREAARG